MTHSTSEATAAADGKTPSAAADIILDVNNIEVIYDHVILVLKGVSLQVPRGGIVAIQRCNYVRKEKSA